MIDLKILFYIYTSLYIAIYRLTIKYLFFSFFLRSLNDFCWFGIGLITLLMKKKTWFGIYFESIFMQKLLLYFISNYRMDFLSRTIKIVFSCKMPSNNLFYLQFYIHDSLIYHILQQQLCIILIGAQNSVKCLVQCEILLKYKV